MAGVNKAIILGNLGNDPELRFFPDGGAIATCSIATSETWNDKQTGQKQERTEWHKVVFRDRGKYKLGQIAGDYLKKGSKVYVEGKIQTRKWQGQDGQDRYTTEIVADNMQMLTPRSEQGGGHQQGAQQGHQQGHTHQQGPQQGYAEQGGGQGSYQNPGSQRAGGAPQQGHGGGQPQTSQPPQGQLPPQGDFGSFDDDIPF